MGTYDPRSTLSSLHLIARFYNRGVLTLFDLEGDLPKITGAQIHSEPRDQKPDHCFVLCGTPHVLSELESFKVAIAEQQNPTSPASYLYSTREGAGRRVKSSPSEGMVL